MLFAALWPAVLNFFVFLLGIVLIFLVLIQRGKGGGLAGAFGGVGGSSAFGSRAGDMFTKITIYVALAWVLTIMAQIWVISGTKGTVENPDPLNFSGQQ